MKAALIAALGPELDRLPELLAEMEPEARVGAIAKLIGYILPKPTENTEEHGTAWSVAQAIAYMRGEAGATEPEK